MHYPTDVNLLWEAMRCLLGELGGAARKHNIGGWRQWGHLTQEVKKCFNQVRSTRRAKSRPDRVEAYLERCWHLVGRAEESCKELEQAGVAQSSILQCLIAHARRQMDQIERRLLKGETIAHDEKVFSIFEEHTRWISKGKAGRAVELGVPVCVVEDQFQFILHHKILWEGSDTDIAVSIIEETQALHPDLHGCAASTVGSTAPATGRNSTPCSTSMRCRARVGFLWPSASARKRKHLPRPGASTRRSSRQSTTLSIAVSIGFAPTAPMGLHTPLPCRYWPPTCTASACLCDGACVTPNVVEDAALPEPGQLLRISPPGPPHGDGYGLLCPEVGIADRFDAEHPSVVSVPPVPWLKPRRNCRGSSQFPCTSGGFLADTN